ncbi:hypothetical protein ACFPOI_21885 [Nonomuraea angiospora]|uniref:Secreted protein n=1 Tax=Nonomuraea angiospora TaxID=46172 RepID=A0ABR9MK59_9ACTN|nr:hypothetical protein [Nonomuraea angiospora]MBE1593319.1 hypothetical protein [Nonomuraea angiospora]
MRKLLTPLVVAASTLAALAGTTASVSATSAASDTSPAQVEVQGVQLTPAQAKALRHAAAADPGLTRDQAAKIVSARGQVGANASGSGKSTGPCGEARLWGDSYGHYSFGLDFRVEQVGTAALGGVTISTDSPLPDTADKQSFGVSGASVGNDTAGQAWYTLSSIGWGATKTTMEGWALTTGAWWCGIDVKTIQWK